MFEEGAQFHEFKSLISQSVFGIFVTVPGTDLPSEFDCLSTAGLYLTSLRVLSVFEMEKWMLIWTAVYITNMLMKLFVLLVSVS